MSARLPQVVASSAERVLNIRKTPSGHGQQYEIQWQGQAETTWEAASRVRRQIPALVRAFEETLQQQQQQQDSDDAMADEEGGANQEGAADGSSMRAQMEAMQQLVREQAQQLQQLRASPQPSPKHPHEPSPQQSRFARKEPRAQDLREYEGASGPKLDAWLDELGAAVDLFHLNGGEAVDFGASRLRGAARQWWNTLGNAGKATINSASTLATALRARFQPITSERVAREHLRALKQGGRHINDYIADFQRLHALLPDMSQADALFAFESGVSAPLAEKLRVQGVSSVPDAIALAARVGGLMQTPAIGRSSATAAQMEVDDGESNGSASRLDRIEAALNALTTAHGNGGGLGAKTQTQRGYQQQRGGRSGSKVSDRRPPMQPPQIQGVPDDVIQQRWADKQCLRCGAHDHRSMACPNSVSAARSSGSSSSSSMMGN